MIFIPLLHPIKFIKEIIFSFSKNMTSIQYCMITMDIKNITFANIEDEDQIIKDFIKKYNLKCYNFQKSIFPSFGNRSSQVYYIPTKIYNFIKNKE